jgi:hypothetical protein
MAMFGARSNLFLSENLIKEAQAQIYAHDTIMEGLVLLYKHMGDYTFDDEAFQQIAKEMVGQKISVAKIYNRSSRLRLEDQILIMETWVQDDMIVAKGRIVE